MDNLRIISIWYDSLVGVIMTWEINWNKQLSSGMNTTLDTSHSFWLGIMTKSHTHPEHR